MNDLLAFMYVALLVFAMAWIVQLGAHPNSARTAFAAIIMTGSVMVIIGCVAFTIFNLILRAWL